MSDETFGRRFRLFYAVAMWLLVAVFLANVWSSGPVTWLLLGAVAAGTFVFTGPVRWALPEVVPDSWIKMTRDVAIVVLLGAALAVLLTSARLRHFGWMVYVEAVVIGAILGYGVVVVAESTAVPDRVRQAAR